MMKPGDLICWRWCDEHNHNSVITCVRSSVMCKTVRLNNNEISMLVFVDGEKYSWFNKSGFFTMKFTDHEISQPTPLGG